jgi:hypothetical protein
MVTVCPNRGSAGTMLVNVVVVAVCARNNPQASRNPLARTTRTHVVFMAFTLA